MDYRIVTGNKDTEPTRIEYLQSANLGEARRELTVTLRQYNGQGQGRIEREVWGNGIWYTLAERR